MDNVCGNCKHLNYCFICKNEDSEFYNHLKGWIDNCSKFKEKK